MYELSLFTGAGGGIWGSKLLGWQTIGYVEFNDYCQRVIRQRILDGIFCEAPIFGDIGTFISEGYADAYRGMVDVVTAGFPCQPFSTTGSGGGENDPRNKWPQTIEVIRRVRPRYALLENVPGLLADEYVRRIFGDLAEAGVDCEWEVISARELGADHTRRRLWIGPTDSSRVGCEGELFFKESQTRFKNSRLSQTNQCDRRSRGPWRDAFPGVCRMVHGLAYGSDRIRALGNGQIPIVVREAWHRLKGGS